MVQSILIRNALFDVISIAGTWQKEARSVYMSREKEKNQEKIEAEQAVDDRIRETGQVTLTDHGDGNIHLISIIGEIEGHENLGGNSKTTKYEHILPSLAAIEDSKKIQGVLVILNTMGGDVEAGLAIAELLSTMNTPTVSLVLGGGHSIGVPLAVSCKRSFIAPTATMTIHPVRMNGTVLGVPQTLSYFEKMQDRIARFVEANSSICAEDFRKLMLKTGELIMDVGSVLDGEEAVSCGLIDELGGLSDALGYLQGVITGEN